MHVYGASILSTTMRLSIVGLATPRRCLLRSVLRLAHEGAEVLLRRRLDRQDQATRVSGVVVHAEEERRQAEEERRHGRYEIGHMGKRLLHPLRRTCLDAALRPSQCARVRAPLSSLSDLFCATTILWLSKSSPVLRLRSKCGKLEEEMSSRIRWPAANRFDVG